MSARTREHVREAHLGAEVELASQLDDRRAKLGNVKLDSSSSRPMRFFCLHVTLRIHALMLGALVLHASMT
jgi:hypothetical protein